MFYTGSNNGFLFLPVRKIAENLPCSKDTVSRALTELEDTGFIQCMSIGRFASKNRKASEYRLTLYPCNRSHQKPTKEFMSLFAPEKPLSAHSQRQPPVRSQKRERPLTGPYSTAKVLSLPSDRTVRPQGQGSENNLKLSHDRDRQGSSDPSHGITTGTQIYIPGEGDGETSNIIPLPVQQMDELPDIPAFLDRRERVAG